MDILMSIIFLIGLALLIIDMVYPSWWYNLAGILQYAILKLTGCHHRHLEYTIILSHVDETTGKTIYHIRVRCKDCETVLGDYFIEQTCLPHNILETSSEGAQWYALTKSDHQRIINC